MVLDFVEAEMSDRYQLKLNPREVHGEVQRGMIDRSFQCRQRSAAGWTPRGVTISHAAAPPARE